MCLSPLLLGPGPQRLPVHCHPESAQGQRRLWPPADRALLQAVPGAHQPRGGCRAAHRHHEAAALQRQDDVRQGRPEPGPGALWQVSGSESLFFYLVIMRCEFDPWVELPLEKEVAAHSSILAWQAVVHGIANLATKQHVYPASFSVIPLWVFTSPSSDKTCWTVCIPSDVGKMPSPDHKLSSSPSRGSSSLSLRGPQGRFSSYTRSERKTG